MKTVYGVRWIEVEFGQRDEGWSLFVDANECIKKTKQASVAGNYGGGYLGPERPLIIYEIPWDDVPEDLQKELEAHGSTHSPNHWHPKFKDRGSYIKDDDGM